MQEAEQADLHSIMYLLIQLSTSSVLLKHFDLHSIMYLLIPGENGQPDGEITFTFHNVSINSNYPKQNLTH